ncbi:MAG TPA: AAA family ATPase [bacterium]|nr:AAA family ATPase [bacterium]
MTTHISARLAWHDNGWNGCICRNPKTNTYCIGPFSFPGDMIAERRNLEIENPYHGQSVDKVPDYYIPCLASINAFGSSSIPAQMPPPSWFKDKTSPRTWTLPPYTICTWPYEEVYKETVRNTETKYPKYDPVKRRRAVNDYFAQIKPGASLIFYYANFSNPFSENDTQRYVVVGLSRIKSIGEEITWTDQSEEMEKRYGPNVWMREITSYYPDEGLRIPYHLYMDKPDILERILFVPENPRYFKYATRHISDDGALALVEKMAEIVGVLLEIEDKHENWQQRLDWLNSLMAELWHNRGLYPGLLRVLDYLKFTEGITHLNRHLSSQDEQQQKDALFAFLRGEIDTIPGLALKSERIPAVKKQWRLLDPYQQTLLSDILPRFDLRTDQIKRIIEHPEEVSIRAMPQEINKNPYILSEQYIGLDADDQINFSQIDHGMLPSPDLGRVDGVDPDGWQRLRALCVEQLVRQDQHTFMRAEAVLTGVNRKLSFLPKWKKADFSLRHLEIDRDEIDQALVYRQEAETLYLYLKEVFEDEREVEKILRQMANRPNIKLKFPMTEGNWRLILFDTASPLGKTHPNEYEDVIAQQIKVCQGIFLRPISILCGNAGTGKTTVVSAIIRAIEKAHGTGTSFQLLAPTGKAADRLRDRTGKEAATIHSFLAKRGWLNDNFTFKRKGGKQEESITTYIIDESSMLDLPLIAALFRAINWTSVQRLIFVGDPNQLPPIGTGRVFADLMDWLQQEQPEAIGELATNMRQIINRLTGKGTGIIDLASIFLRNDTAHPRQEEDEINEEELLAKTIEGGDVSGDLRILYWNQPDELEQILMRTLVGDLEKDSGKKLDPEKPYEIWNAVLKKDGVDFPEALQIISPYRGELFGTENINSIIQRHKGGWLLDRTGHLGGITFFDKVIQSVNRPKSNPVWAYCCTTRKNEKIEIFNGEIGLVRIHGFDTNKWRNPYFRIERFQVVFSRKPEYWVDYESETSVTENLELAYAISVHKSQGSEFQRVYFIFPKYKQALLSRELFYTGITRAQSHCTLLIQEDISPILSLRRPENSILNKINSSLFHFKPSPPELHSMQEWYEEGKIHRTLTNLMVRSKSEVIIANMLADRNIPFMYETPLYAPDGTLYLPDFTINMYGEQWYWEHLGMLSKPRYREHWEKKKAWYEKHGYAENLITTTEEGGFNSKNVQSILKNKFGID